MREIKPKEGARPALNSNQVRIVRPNPDGTRELIDESPVTNTQNHVTLCFRLIDDLLASGLEPSDFDGLIVERYVDGKLEGEIPVSPKEVQLIVERRAKNLVE